MSMSRVRTRYCAVTGLPVGHPITNHGLAELFGSSGSHGSMYPAGGSRPGAACGEAESEGAYS